jgi:hypothetical protein
MNNKKYETRKGRLHQAVICQRELTPRLNAFNGIQVLNQKNSDKSKPVIIGPV